MTNEDVSPEGVYLAAGDYFGVPGDNPMSDDDGDGIWTITMAMPLGYSGAYTFTNGACGDWSCKENIVGQDCAYGTWSDRFLEEVTANGATISTCFAQCTSDGFCESVSAAEVTFQVDMSDYSGSFNEVFVTGGFDGWCGSCIPMTDFDGTGIYSATVSLESNMSYEYMYVVDGWQDAEQLTPGDPCVLTSGDFTNRLLETGDEDMVLSPVCWNSCFACPESDISFYEDFANGFAGNNGVGGWTVEDTGGGLIWQYVDESGNGFYADGSASGVNPPAGEFSTNIESLNSTSASNGWVIYDNDYWNTPISEGYSDNEGWLTSPVLNLSESASVIVSWEQYFRYCCHPDAPVYLQVTNDGGESWVTFDGHGDFIEAPNTVSENGFTTTVDISCMAAGESNVQIRFSYLQAPETGEGYSHYFWGIDDVMIFEAPVNNDLEVLQVTNGDVSEGWELTVTPMEQLPLIENGGVLTGVMFRNVGNLDQTDVELQVEVLDTDGNLLESVTQNVGLVPASANSEQCPIHPSDTSYVSTNWVPEEIGVYELRVTISSDAEDELPMNNVFSRMIEFSEEQMGHDKEAVDYEFVPSDSDIDGLFNPTGYGNHFKMENPGSLVYGLAIKFGPNSGGGVLEFETRLYEVQGTIEWEDALLNSTSWLYDDDWTPSELDQSEFVYLPFDSPVEVNATSSYFAAVISEFESEAQLTIAGNLNTDTDRSTGFYGMDNDGYFSWLSQGLGISELNSTPAIRLVFSPGEFSGCMDPEACNFSPAATTNGFCDYETCAGCMDEEACNFDSQATIEYNGVCTFPGCFDPEASNYSQNAGCEGECFYLTYDCASVGDAAWSDEAIGLFPEWQDAMHGVAWEGEWVFNIPATIVEPGSAVSYGVHHVEWSSVTGIPSWATTDYALADLEASSQHCIAASGTPATPGLHEITASGEVFISIFGQPFSIGEQSFSATLEVMANPNPIPGCTYPLASNYLSYATLDDGGCEYWGCTDIDAADFNPFANIDDGSCGDGCDPLTGSNCASDSNGDGQVNVTDLLILLGEFGGICE